eukprot:1161045-Pelagomonas_calceolata.AAC.13
MLKPAHSPMTSWVCSIQYLWALRRAVTTQHAYLPETNYHPYPQAVPCVCVCVCVCLSPPQVRQEDVPCDICEEFGKIDDSCVGELVTRPYGVDPVFKRGTSLYNPDFDDIDLEIVASIYNCSALDNPTKRATKKGLGRSKRKKVFFEGKGSGCRTAGLPQKHKSYGASQSINVH